MVEYELAIVVLFLGLSYFLVWFADRFKIEGESSTRALMNGIIGLLLKLTAFANLIFMLFIFKIVMQDQTVTAFTTNILSMLDTYNNVFIYVAAIFFLLFFIQQFVTLIYNLNIYKSNKEDERKFV